MDFVSALTEGRCSVPFDFLGVHPDETDASRHVVRVFLPWAAAVTLVRHGEDHSMPRVHDPGLFEASFVADHAFAYTLRVTDGNGQVFALEDPYRFLPVLDETALAPFKDGTERRAHRLLGARVLEHQGVTGTCFSVWAPHAFNVNLMGEFNRWDSRCHPMRPRGSTGVWELFVPGTGRGTHYKFDVRPRETSGRVAKTDPFARAMELRPRTASVVWDGAERYEWGDGEWMGTRAARHAPDAPLAIYEVHVGSWRKHAGHDAKKGTPGWYGYRELADTLLPYAKELGFTHVELLPVAEHPLDLSWGYQTVGYFAPTSRHGTPDDFRYFVDRAHQLGIGVLLDWTPAHFPRDAHGLARFDGVPLFEHPDPRRGAHPDWGTLIFDYGRPEVASFLVSSALYWFEEFHIDGLRVDAVASMLYLDYSRAAGEWVANRYGGRENLEAIAFLKTLNDAVREEYPDVMMIAEESTAWSKVSFPTADGGLGFHFKWNMGWMHDTLEVLRGDPLFRKNLYSKLTFSIWYAESEFFLLPLSHDEVVHMKGSLYGRMPGSPAQKLANLRLLLTYMWMHPGKKLLFMGGEFGQPSEWNFEKELEWGLLASPGHKGVQALVARLNQLYAAEPALHNLEREARGFEWLECHDAARTTIAFIRWAPEWTDPVVVAANFTPMVWEGYRLPVPFSGTYEVLLNSASQLHGADPAHDLPETLDAVEGELHGRKHYLEFDFPPLAAIALKVRSGAER